MWRQDLALFVLRVVTGGLMAVLHGSIALPPTAAWIQKVGTLGFPYPAVFAWASGLSEMAGAVLIALGFGTRIAAGFLGFTMLVAATLGHRGEPLGPRELSLLYLAPCVALVLLGGGRWSLDTLLFRSRSKKKR